METDGMNANVVLQLGSKIKKGRKDCILLGRFEFKPIHIFCGERGIAFGDPKGGGFNQMNAVRCRSLSFLFPHLVRASSSDLL
jgi:hypothetical protein